MCPLIGQYGKLPAVGNHTFVLPFDLCAACQGPRATISAVQPTMIRQIMGFLLPHLLRSAHHQFKVRHVLRFLGLLYCEGCYFYICSKQRTCFFSQYLEESAPPSRVSEAIHWYSLRGTVDLRFHTLLASGRRTITTIHGKTHPGRSLNSITSMVSQDLSDSALQVWCASNSRPEASST